MAAVTALRDLLTSNGLDSNTTARKTRAAEREAAVRDARQLSAQQLQKLNLRLQDWLHVSARSKLAVSSRPGSMISWIFTK